MAMEWTDLLEWSRTLRYWQAQVVGLTWCVSTQIMAIRTTYWFRPNWKKFQPFTTDSLRSMGETSSPPLPPPLTWREVTMASVYVEPYLICFLHWNVSSRRTWLLLSCFPQHPMPEWWWVHSNESLDKYLLMFPLPMIRNNPNPAHFPMLQSEQSS